MKTNKTYTKNENGFYTNYTEEDALRNMKELKESGDCGMTNPEFYTLWKWDNNKVEDEETKRLKREEWLKDREALKSYFRKRK